MFVEHYLNDNGNSIECIEPKWDNIHVELSMRKYEEIFLLNGALNGSNEMYALNGALKGNKLNGARRSSIT
jgi:hypothetical protein